MLSFAQGSKCNIELRVSICTLQLQNWLEVRKPVLSLSLSLSIFSLSLFLSPSLPLSLCPSSSSSHFNKAEASGSSRAIPACTSGIINTVSLCDRVLYSHLEGPKLVYLFNQIDLQSQGNCGMPMSPRSAESVSAQRFFVGEGMGDI